MKRIITLFFSAVLLFSAVFAGTVPVSAEENLFDRFELLCAYALRYEDRAPSSLDIDDMGYWIFRQYVETGDDYKSGIWRDGKFIEGDGIDGAVPADKFEEAAHRVFDFEGTVKERVLANTADFKWLNYDSDADRFIIAIGGMGGVPIEECGYTADGGGYHVYVRTGDFGDFESGEIKWDDFYIKFDVEWDGKYIKIKTVGKVSTLPTENELITRETDLSDVKYDTAGGISIDGDGSFPKNTTVSAKKLDNGGTVDKVKKALSGEADGEIVVFDIGATLNGAAVQPSGKVSVIFDIPEKLSTENLKLFYVDDDGNKEEIALTVDTAGRKASAELEHFSIYALCNVGPKAPTTTTGGSSTTTGEPTITTGEPTITTGAPTTTQKPGSGQSDGDGGSGLNVGAVAAIFAGVAVPAIVVCIVIAVLKKKKK